jgi:hypothetical protein
MIPAHPQPTPWILAKDQVAYTAMIVAIFNGQALQVSATYSHPSTRKEDFTVEK